MNPKREVIHGLCGWSDPSLAQCRRVFPPKTSSSIDKLRYLSRSTEIGCIEVNSTTYAIPHEKSVQEWIDATPAGFTFHFKAFGALCGSDVDLKQIPLPIRQKYELQGVGRFRRNEHPEAFSDLWILFNDSLEPAVRSRKIGVVIFQFHTNFAPTDTSREFVEECANSLRGDVKMAVEFRDRNWIGWCNSQETESPYQNPAMINETIAWLRSLRNGNGVALIASDEIFAETFSNGLPQSLRPLLPEISDTRSLPIPNSVNTPRLPIFLSSSPSSQFLYIRIHRREGSERLLSLDELTTWISRIESVMQITEESPHPPDDCRGLNGPCYVLWGTDFEDQPLLNIKHFNELLPIQYQQKKLLSKGGPQDIQKFFQKRKLEGEEDETERREGKLLKQEENLEHGESCHLRENSRKIVSKDSILSYFKKK
jgi:uncharacterized protein YecE (DUF72 family)